MAHSKFAAAGGRESRDADDRDDLSGGFILRNSATLTKSQVSEGLYFLDNGFFNQVDPYYNGFKRHIPTSTTGLTISSMIGTYPSLEEGFFATKIVCSVYSRYAAIDT
jgi:hypothetical protein